MKRHPGIRIDSIVAGGAVGLLFAIGALAILLEGVPELREFLVLTLVAGLGFGAFFVWRNR